MGVKRPTTEELRQAVLWRQAFIARVDEAIGLLSEAEAGAPVSVERIKIRRALDEAGRARADAQSNVNAGEHELRIRSAYAC